VIRKILQTQCAICKKTFDDSAMYKSKVYYNISKEAEEARKNKKYIPYELGSEIGSVMEKIIDEANHCSDWDKKCMLADVAHDLAYNYELRTLSYCRNCASVANFTRIGPSSWSKPKVKN
jgi:hypothetical protein